MTLYSHPQLRLLLVLAGTVLLGLTVREWRAGFPELADRLERFDRDEPTTPLPAVPIATTAAPGRSAARGDSGAEAILTSAARTSAPRTHGEPGAAGARTVEPREPPRAPAPAAPRPLDLNQASLEQIARLPGVGPGLARRILDERERRGRFDSPDALRSVLGLGPKKLAALRDLVTAKVE
ncbi:MAG TPA: helix-hairpin-helix domain-containing protein [Candidatus Limnocylindrales bacterium]|nr:helix-hairpin-helix domain-containing protein [Candidatus Limnocylindrales bacterium]